VSLTPTIHASVVLVGAHAVLIRGPAGSGKSRLVLDLIQSASNGPLMFARLVADDRVHVQASHDRLIARPPAVLAGLLEVRGLGIRQMPYEPVAVVSWVVDLDAATSLRMPEGAATQAAIAGVWLPRLAVAPGCDPFPMVLATLTSGFSAKAASPNNAWPKGHDGQPLATTPFRASQA
jgi:serine kinase of HPr protein (carbohydrate metabolism regulator)